jgi:hypothetical protein
MKHLWEVTDEEAASFDDAGITYAAKKDYERRMAEGLGWIQPKSCCGPHWMCGKHHTEARKILGDHSVGVSMPANPYE